MTTKEEVNAGLAFSTSKFMQFTDILSEIISRKRTLIPSILKKLSENNLQEKDREEYLVRVIEKQNALINIYDKNIKNIRLSLNLFASQINSNLYSEVSSKSERELWLYDYRKATTVLFYIFEEGGHLSLFINTFKETSRIESDLIKSSNNVRELSDNLKVIDKTLDKASKKLIKSLKVLYKNIGFVVEDVRKKTENRVLKNSIYSLVISAAASMVWMGALSEAEGGGKQIEFNQFLQFLSIFLGFVLMLAIPIFCTLTISNFIEDWLSKKSKTESSKNE